MNVTFVEETSPPIAPPMTYPWPRPTRRPSSCPRKLRPREKKDEEPELARSDAAKRSTRAGGQQRQDDEGHHGEANRRSQFLIVNPAHQRVQPGFLDEE